MKVEKLSSVRLKAEDSINQTNKHIMRYLVTTYADETIVYESTIFKVEDLVKYLNELQKEYNEKGRFDATVIAFYNNNGFVGKDNIVY